MVYQQEPYSQACACVIENIYNRTTCLTVRFYIQTVRCEIKKKKKKEERGKKEEEKGQYYEAKAISPIHAMGF